MNSGNEAFKSFKNEKVLIEAATFKNESLKLMMLPKTFECLS